MSSFGVCRLFNTNQSLDWEMFCIDWCCWRVSSVSALHCVTLFRLVFLFQCSTKAGKRSTWMHRSAMCVWLSLTGAPGLKLKVILNTVYTHNTSVSGRYRSLKWQRVVTSARHPNTRWDNLSCNVGLTWNLVHLLRGWSTGLRPSRTPPSTHGKFS